MTPLTAAEIPCPGGFGQTGVAGYVDKPSLSMGVAFDNVIDVAPLLGLR